MSKIEVNEIVNQTGDNDSGIDLSTNDVVAVKTANTERMRVDASGNVGIGTTSPDTPLTIDGGSTDNTVAHFKSGSANTYIKLSDSNTSNGVFVGATTEDLTLWSNNTERMRIDSTGNKIMNPASTSSQISAGTHSGSFFAPAGQYESCRATSSTSTHVTFRNTNGSVGTIKTSSSSTSYNTSSDYRIKENVVTDWDATTRLKQLKPSRFNFKVEKDTTVDGFIAHEVSSVVPEAISGEKDEVDKDGNPEYQGIDQSKLVPLLTKALQEAVAKIETLEAKVTALEGK